MRFATDMYYKTLRIRDAQKMDKLPSKLVCLKVTDTNKDASLLRALSIFRPLQILNVL